jgi:threonine synthase
MQYVSTRGAVAATSLSDALAAGLSPDGGLFVPASLPRFDAAGFAGADSLPRVAARLLAPFFAGDRLEPQLDAICAEAFEFDAPLRPLGHDTWLLELFHGPTAAFKDYGARFLAACLGRLRRPGDAPLTIVVATSGDTGAAVGGAFHGRPGLRVVILYPDGRVSPRQAHQLGAFGDNVRALRVGGSFDDCQALVKRALNDAALHRALPLSSANSISLGRLLPQMAYYAHAALQFEREHGRRLGFIVPTGNLGNGLAAVLARACGLPIGEIVLATNANDVLPRFFAGEAYAPRTSVATLANAMDVGAPSNFERLRWLFPDEARLRDGFVCAAVDDQTIRDTIRDTWAAERVAVCPHTATGLALRRRLDDGAGPPQGRQPDGRAWAVAATAHPAKFEGIVEPLIGAALAPPPALAALLARASHAEPLANEYGEFVAALRS